MTSQNYGKKHFKRLLPTGVSAGSCRSAVTMDDATVGTSSVGDLEGAGLGLWSSPGGSEVVAAGCWSCVSVKVTDLFWSACAGRRGHKRGA